jgi:hypothetical protein
MLTIKDSVKQGYQPNSDICPQLAALCTAGIDRHMHDQRLLIIRLSNKVSNQLLGRTGSSPVLLHDAARQVCPLLFVRVPHRERPAHHANPKVSFHINRYGSAPQLHSLLALPHSTSRAQAQHDILAAASLVGNADAMQSPLQQKRAAVSFLALPSMLKVLR